MKKIQLATLSLAALALASCSQEDGWFSKNVAYKGVVETNEATRSYNAGNGAFRWNEGDNIKVWTGSGFSVMEMIDGADTDVAGYASISGTPQDVAVFPVSAASSYEGGELKVNYPAEHNDWTVDTKAVDDPMVAYIAGGDRQFNFFHVGGVIEWDVKMPAGIDQFQVDMPSAVTGDFIVTNSDGVPTVATTTTTGTNNVVTFNFEKTTADTEMHFYMPVPTGTYDGIVVWIKGDGRNKDKKTATMSHTINRCDWVKIPLTMGGYTGVIEKAVSSETELLQLANEGGSALLKSDITATQTIAVPDGKTLSLNLNGSTVNNTTDIWDQQPNDWSLASVRGGNMTITGNGSMIAKENDCYAVDVQDGGHLVIESGHFNGNVHAVYVEEGTAEIKGGTFEIQQKYTDASKADEFVLNCLDANRKNGTAKIIVTGGRFINFNPADCWAEGEHTNFVADGYTSVVVSTSPMTYEVVKCTSEANTAANLLSALQNKTDANVINVGSDFTVDNFIYYSKLSKTITLSNNAKITTSTDKARAIKASTGSSLNIGGTGVIEVCANSNPKTPYMTAAIEIEKAKTVNISGNVSIKGSAGGYPGVPNAAVYLNGGTLNISGGYFWSGLTSEGKSNPVIYLTYNAKANSTCNIYGGVFESANPEYLLNIQDDALSNCKFNVYGGIFVGFNPADNTADGEHTNYVAPGYKSVETTYNGKKAWKVVKE